ncbi:MAG: Ni/Fe-hydrogenase cytochrome b subunit [Anaerolineales bacterium]|jgi:Ni/Fe-hydrogenase subunit HybB-like protein
MKLKLTIQERFRIGLLPVILLVLIGIAFVFAMIRYADGIGSISNLSNAYPWGFWISFDLFTGVAIGSGAFVMAATVYIFELKEFQPLVRPSVLTGLLGYTMVVIALLVDLGHPERIWYMLIHHNHTSVLLEIGLCVMSYLTVLAIEFAPVIFEGLKWEKWAHLLHKFIMPFVIAGVVLSTLHQSSLGSLLLIQPEKLFPLWWTPILPVEFFISSLVIGLAMVVFESSLSSRYFKHGLELDLLEKLSRAVPYVLGIYLLVKFGEIFIAGDAHYLFTGGSMSLLFWIEILLSAAIPLVLFSIKKIRSNANGILVSSIILLIGMILNRFDVSWFAVKHPDPLTYLPSFMSNHVHYWPSLPEVSISIGIFSAGILAFGLIAKHFPLFDDGHKQHATGD